jgi:hypothetical protein
MKRYSRRKLPITLVGIITNLISRRLILKLEATIRTRLYVTITANNSRVGR